MGAYPCLENPAYDITNNLGLGYQRTAIYFGIIILFFNSYKGADASITILMFVMPLNLAEAVLSPVPVPFIHAFRVRHECGRRQRTHADHGLAPGAGFGLGSHGSLRQIVVNFHSTLISNGAREYTPWGGVLFDSVRLKSKIKHE